MLRNAIQEFPNNYDLLYCLARTLCFTKKPYVFLNEEEKQKNLRESISICKRILVDCTDDNLRFRSLQVLARAYKDIGEKEKAIETANKLPLARDSRDMVLPEILDEEARSNQIVQNIWLLSDMFEYADYIKLKDYDNALNCIEKFVEHSIKWDVLPEISTYTSIIFQGETCLKNKDFDDMKNTTLGAKEILVSREIFTLVREHVRFKTVITKLEKHIK